MQTKKFKNNLKTKSMRATILILLIMACLTVSGHPNFGYKIFYKETKNEKLKIAKTESIDSVRSVMDFIIGSNCIDIKSIMRDTRCFNVSNEQKVFYVELYEVVHGKYKAISNRRWKEIKEITWKK